MMPASVRTALTSGMTPSYCTGISQPSKGTLRAPSATWRSRRGVCCNVWAMRPMLTRRRKVPLRLRLELRRLAAFAPARLAAESRGDHRDLHLVTEGVVDDGSEDDVRVLVGGTR